ncbi:Protein transport protein Sec61 subunit gamma [Hordeum vulgare]|nr:Protein transport protein Sec61 subunit gamma [Hordeum vulgare]
MDAVDSVVEPLREFAKDIVRLVKRCHKPDRKGKDPRARALPSFSDPVRFPLSPDLTLIQRAEFTKVAVRTTVGFVVMGFVGFFVNLIFIPINNIIVGSG